MKSIEFQGKIVAYHLEGRGTTLVFLHGFCEDSQMWDEFAMAFQNYRVLRIDLPGFGCSELQEEHSMEVMAEAVKAVLDHLKIKKCFLIGHSMGGYVGVAFAKKYAGRLLGLVMFHSHPFADSDEKKTGRTKAIEFIKKNGHLHFVKQLMPKLFATKFSPGFPMELNKLIFNAARCAPEAIISALEAMSERPDNSIFFGEIDCPVLFIIGKKDSAIPLEVSLAQTHLPNIADIHILQNVGHMGMFEAKQETTKILKFYLQTLKFNK